MVEIQVSHQLSADTQVALLLCSRFSRENTDTPTPLKPSEYNQIAKWLLRQDMRPGDLLEYEARERLQQSTDELSDAQRVLYLLDRGGLLALQVESWTNQGLWVISRSDEAYPQRLRERLKQLSPPILYGAGDPRLLAYGGLAMVGSRNTDAIALDFTRAVGRRCVQDGIQVISGGARGVDQTAMLAALEAEGNVIGILANDLARASVSSQYRDALREERLVLVSPYAPRAGFNVGNAMGRNKLIYALSDWTLVVSSDAGKGGTWTGATENLRHGWAPVFVRMEPGVPPGNQGLVDKGALPLQPEILDNSKLPLSDLLDQVQADQATRPTVEVAPSLFDQKPEASQPTAEPVAADSPSIPLETIDPDSFWNQIIWPIMIRLLAEHGSLNREVLSTELGIKNTQADEWIKRAVDDEKLKKKTRPVRYVIPNGEQIALLDNG